MLIALSVTLTFSIWTYTPKYPTIEQPPTVDIAIANKMDLEDVIKPYRLLFNFEEYLRGTTDPGEIEYVISELKNWTISGLVLKDPNFEADKLDSLMKRKNSFTLYYHTEIPLPVYANIFNIEDINTEDSFDRMIIEWNSTNTALDIHFISRANNLRYSAKAHVKDSRNFYLSVLPTVRSYSNYEKVSTSEAVSIVVPVDGIELVRNTYTQEEFTPSKFRNALFSDPNAVLRRSQVATNSEEFQDDHARMTVNTLKKNLNYVHPVVESNELALPSELLLNTFDFINEHGGWTDDYRLTRMNPLSRSVEFQLHVHGLPVYSNATSTKIEQVWGEDRIFRYIRPYYTLGLPLPSEKETILLPSGVEVIETITKSEEIDGSTVEEIIPGYYMKHDTDRGLFMLEPSWFYKIKDNWIRYSPEQLGGDPIGLE